MNKMTKAAFATAVISLCIAQSAWAASTKDEILELKEEVKGLKEGQATMQKDLADIKKLLEAGAKPAAQRPAPKPFEPRDVSVAGAPVMGQEKAQLTLIEYSDYQCPFCRRHKDNTLPQLKENYIDTAKLKFVMREFPLTSLHPRAVAASLAALCASDQGKYWQMHDVLFENQREMSDEQITSYAESAGLDVATFTECMDSGKYDEQVQRDLAEGREMGIGGTPSFALGVTDPSDPTKVKVVKIIKGAQSFDVFSKEIEALLNPAGDAVAEANP